MQKCGSQMHHSRHPQHFFWGGRRRGGEGVMDPSSDKNMLQNETALHRVIKNDCRGFNLVLQMQTPCDFFLWSYVMDQVYVPPLRASIPELKVWIRTAIETITADMLQTVWNELDYRVDVCRITKGALNNMKTLKIKNWTSCIQDRNMWKSYVEKAKTFKYWIYSA